MTVQTRLLLPAAVLACSFLAFGGENPPAENGAPTAQRVDVYGDALPAGASARLGTTRFRQGGQIHYIAYALDGKAIVSAGTDQVVRVWDAVSGRQLHAFENRMFQTVSYSDSAPVAVGPDGKVLLMTDGQTLTLWDLTKWKLIRSFAAHFDCQCVAISPDGRKVVGAGVRPKEGVVQFWDSDTGKALERLPAAEDGTRFMAFSRDGKRLALAGSDAISGVALWDLESRKEIRRIHVEAAAICFSPDGKTLAIATGFSSLSRAMARPDEGSRPEVQFWDISNDKILRPFATYPMRASALIFSRDGKTIGAAGDFEGARLWEVQSGATVLGIPGSEVHPICICFSPDEKMIVCGTSDSMIRVWDVRRRKERDRLAGHRAPVQAIAFAPDGGSLATVNGEGTVRQWQSATGRLIQRFKDDDPDKRRGPSYRFSLAMKALAFSADGTELAVASSDYRLWDTATGKELRHDGIDRFQSIGWMCALSGDGKTTATWDLEKMHVWNEASGASEWPLDSRRSVFGAMALSADGRMLAIASREVGTNATITLRETRTGKEIRTWAIEYDSAWHRHFSPYRSPPLVFSGDGRALAYAIGEEVRIWDTATGKETRRLLDDETSTVRSLAMSPDGRMLAVGGTNKQVRVWEIATGAKRGLFLGHNGPIICLAFDRDCRRIGSGSEDTTALVWDLTGAAFIPKGMTSDSCLQPLEKLWSKLGDADGGCAYAAVWGLVTQGKVATDFLASRLKPAAPVTGARIAALIADLNSHSFEVREKAGDELEALRELAEPALRKVCESSSNPRARQRAQEILAALAAGPDAGRRQELRAVEALERMGTGEAREVLKKLAGGAPEARLTLEAKNAVERMEKGR